MVVRNKLELPLDSPFRGDNGASGAALPPLRGDGLGLGCDECLLRFCGDAGGVERVEVLEVGLVVNPSRLRGLAVIFRGDVVEWRGEDDVVRSRWRGVERGLITYWFGLLLGSGIVSRRF